MSLDVYLNNSTLSKVPCICRECGTEHTCDVFSILYESNITHNLGRMAEACGIYDCIWRPDENDITTAEQLITHLANGLDKLLSDPEKYRRCEAKNGWGTYESFVKFVSNYLDACHEYPQAKVSVWR